MRKHGQSVPIILTHQSRNSNALKRPATSRLRFISCLPVSQMTCVPLPVHCCGSDRAYNSFFWTDLIWAGREDIQDLQEPKENTYAWKALMFWTRKEHKSQFNQDMNAKKYDHIMETGGSFWQSYFTVIDDFLQCGCAKCRLSWHIMSRSRLSCKFVMLRCYTEPKPKPQGMPWTDFRGLFPLYGWSAWEKKNAAKKDGLKNEKGKKLKMC